jgi:hypothetical protein
MESHNSSVSIPRTSESLHKRSKSHNSQYIIQKKLKREATNGQVISTMQSNHELSVHEKSTHHLVSTNESFDEH